MEYTTTLISKKEIANGTMEFSFKKPDGFSFKAGQSVDITIPNPPETDKEGDTRAFSIAASPSEENIFIATRMRDTAFKRVLREADEGLEVEIKGPFGSFTLHQNEARPAIFLVGGIGITPFRSIIKDATERELPHKLFLFYSNRTPEDAAYFKELEALNGRNPNLTVVNTMTALDDADAWEGERGYIDMDMVSKYVPQKENAVYYSAGPMAMVSSMRKFLEESGVSDDDIRTEEFAGY